MSGDERINGDERIILGIATKAMTAAAAIALLDDNISKRRPTAVAFLNANTAIRATENPKFSQVLRHFVIFNDGVGVNAANWLKYGSGFPENLNGTDFTPLFLARSQHRLRIFLLGARPEVVEQAAQVLAGRYPNHDFVGYRDGYFSSDESEDIVTLIRSRDTSLLLVAMGNPIQELWIADNLDRTGASIALGVGALFDFCAGRVPRAPQLIRWLRIEWLFRLMREPRRLWRRYTLDNLKFLAYAVRDAVEYRFRSG